MYRFQPEHFACDTSISHGGKIFYSADELVLKFPPVFRAKKGRDILKTVELNPDHDFVFVHFGKFNDWKLSIQSNTKAKMFVSDEWCSQNISYNGTMVADVPDPIPFEKEENASLLSLIEARGRLRHNEIFFRMEESERVALPHRQIPRYDLPVDVQKFRENGVAVNYLTWVGIQRLSRESGSEILANFLKILEESYLPKCNGSTESTSKIYSDDKKLSEKILRGLPGIYLIKVCSLGQFRNKIDVNVPFPDSSTLYKIGRSKDVFGRLDQHRSKYNSFLDKKDTITLEFAIHIDEERQDEAERDIMRNFAEFRIPMSTKYNELFVFNDLDPVRAFYIGLNEKYMISRKELNSENVALRDKIETLNLLIAEKERMIQTQESHIASFIRKIGRMKRGYSDDKKQWSDEKEHLLKKLSDRETGSSPMSMLQRFVSFGK